MPSGGACVVSVPSWRPNQFQLGSGTARRAAGWGGLRPRGRWGSWGRRQERRTPSPLTGLDPGPAAGAAPGSGRWSAAPPTSASAGPRNPPAARAPGGAARRAAASPLPPRAPLFLARSSGSALLPHQAGGARPALPATEGSTPWTSALQDVVAKVTPGGKRNVALANPAAPPGPPPEQRAWP